MTLMLTVESGCTEKCIYAFPRIMGQCFSSRTQATPIVAAAESPPLVKLGLEEMAMATGNPIIKVAAVCGSLRKGSFNRGLIRAGPLKNAIDWASRPPNVWQDKPAAIMSAGGAFGGGRSQYHLRQVGVFLDLHFINKPELFVQAFQPPQKFDSEGNLIDPETKERVKNLLLSLYAFTLRLKNIC
ncbi:NAD(P)H dehydrogenase (quinone) protein [Dioscorea alata]|uniref:NAD(P)H dehydrogenase (Quinone) protein n=1 Tax=Dioscorea alata TaxID=55571 RepID=A0ACB7V1C5_DIOAL|nr:NAD(P)H dehydrogenase (quinone) protein [Dioscorea alata]